MGFIEMSMDSIKHILDVFNYSGDYYGIFIHIRVLRTKYISLLDTVLPGNIGDFIFYFRNGTRLFHNIQYRNGKYVCHVVQGHFLATPVFCIFSISRACTRR